MPQVNNFFIAKPDLESLLFELTYGSPKVWIGAEFVTVTGQYSQYTTGYAIATAFIPFAPDHYTVAEFRQKVCEFEAHSAKESQARVDAVIAEMRAEAEKHGVRIEKGVITSKQMTS